jgi:anti-anti-sigma regulatory factor
LADRDRPAALAPSLALNVTLSRGRRRAAARVELHQREAWRVGWVRLWGSVGREAVVRLGRVLEDLEGLGCRHVLLDWADVSHLDYRAVPALLRALERFEGRAGGYVLCGLSRYLRDLIRVAGCELRSWPSAAELLAGGADAWGPHAGECAS